MSDDLVKRLDHFDADDLHREAANRIEALETERDALRDALEWYGDQTRLARLIHSEGDAGRHALAEDGGDRARAALNREAGA